MTMPYDRDRKGTVLKAVNPEDFYDEDMSVEPSYAYDDGEQPHDDGEQDDEQPTTAATPAPPAVPITIAKKPDQVLQARRRQKEAESAAHERKCKRVADVESARAWLAAHGAVATALDDEGALHLRHDMEHRETVLANELRQLAELDGVRVMAEERSARIVGRRHFFSIEAAWTYPNGSEPITVDSGNQTLRSALGQLVQRTARRGQPGLFALVARLCLELSNAPPPLDDDEEESTLRDAWQKLAGEVLLLSASNHQVELKLSGAEAAEAERRRAAKAAAERSVVSRKVPVFRCKQTHRLWQREPEQQQAHGTEAQDRVAALLSAVSEVERTSVSIRSPFVTSIPARIRNFQFITTLDFGRCSLRTLPPLGNMKLQKVYFGWNQFDVFPEALLTDPIRNNLRVLDMSCNRLQALPAALGEFARLELMLFDYNSIRELPPLEKLQRLEVLEFTDNDLRVVPPVVAHLPRLWRLQVGANPVLNLPPFVYYRGLDAVKEYLSDTGAAMYVPASQLGPDVVQLQSGGLPPEGGCDIVLAVSQEDGTAQELHVCAFLLRARLPGLLSVGTVEKLDDGPETGVTHRLCLPPSAGSADAIRLALRLASGTLDGAELMKTDVFSTVSGVVMAHGTPALIRGMLALQRGAGLDAEEAMVADLEAIVRDWAVAPLPEEQLHDGGALPVVANTSEVGNVVAMQVGERRFRADRSLLQARCPYFAGMFASGMTEEGAGVVDVPDVDPDVFESFLTYVYAGTSKKMGPDNVVALLFLAVEYQMARLRAMAECMVGYNVEVDNVAQILQMAHLLDSANLKKVSFHFIDANYAAVRRTDTFHELQDELKAELHDHLVAWGNVRS